MRSRHDRIRRLLGCTVLVCTFSCDTWSDHCYLELPNEPVTLTVDQPVHRSQFLVESNEGSFTFRFTFKTETGEPPRLEARSLEPGAQVQYRSTRQVSDSEFEWRGAATVDCGDEIPCAARFETIVTANPAVPGVVEGTLSGVVRRSNCLANPKQEYLAVEPL